MKFLFTLLALVALAFAAPGGEWNTWQKPCPTVTVTKTEWEVKTVTDYVTKWEVKTVTKVVPEWKTVTVYVTKTEWQPCHKTWGQ